MTASLDEPCFFALFPPFVQKRHGVSYPRLFTGRRSTKVQSFPGDEYNSITWAAVTSALLLVSENNVFGDDSWADRQTTVQC